MSFAPFAPSPKTVWVACRKRWQAVQVFAALFSVVRLDVSGAGAGRQSRSSCATNFALIIIVRPARVWRVQFSLKERRFVIAISSAGDYKSPLLEVELA